MVTTGKIYQMLRASSLCTYIGIFLNAVQHLRDYGSFIILSTEIEAVQDLAVFWIWSLKFCKPLRKNRMVVADDLHYEWAFPVLQFVGRCTNGDYCFLNFVVGRKILLHIMSV
jgi:hypothetical protein